MAGVWRGLAAAIFAILAFGEPWPGGGRWAWAENVPAEIEEQVRLAAEPTTSAVKRTDLVRKLMDLGAQQPAVRKLFCEKLLDPQTNPAVLQAVLEILGNDVAQPESQGKFGPDYVPALVLLAQRDPGAKTDDMAQALLKAYPRQTLCHKLRELAKTPDSAQRGLILAALAVISDSQVFRLDEQMREFVPALIDLIKPEADLTPRVLDVLQGITEMRTLPPTAQDWRAWWDKDMAPLNDLERVLVVHRNLRENRAQIQSALDKLSIEFDESRLKEFREKGRVADIVAYVDLARPSKVLLLALGHLSETVAGAPEDVRKDLLARIKASFTSPLPKVREELAHTAMALGAAGEELVREQLSRELMPGVRATLIEYLARGGSAGESLDLLLQILADASADPQVVSAVVRGMGDWKRYDAASGSRAISALKAWVALQDAKLESPHAVALHNSLNALSAQVNTTAVIQLLFQLEARKTLSVQMQLATVKQALQTLQDGRADLCAWLCEPERKQMFSALLQDAKRLRFEQELTVEILALLGDAFLDTPAVHQALAQLYGDNGRENAALREKIEACVTAFAVTAIKASPDETPLDWRVFDAFMALEMSPMLLEKVLPRLEKLSETEPRLKLEALRPLRARLGLRVPSALDEAIKSYGQFTHAPERQAADIRWALEPGRGAERDFRLRVAPRLINALHPQGVRGPLPAPVWAAVVETLRAQVKPERLGDGPLHVLAVARALYDFDDLQPILAQPGNAALDDFRGAISDARQALARWQATAWAACKKDIAPGRAISEDSRKFVLNTLYELPAVKTLFEAVPGNDAIAVPDLCAQLRTLGHAEPLAQEIWKLITDACLARRRNLVTVFPASDAAYDAAREALFTELRRDHGYAIR